MTATSSLDNQSASFSWLLLNRVGVNGTLQDYLFGIVTSFAHLSGAFQAPKGQPEHEFILINPERVFNHYQTIFALFYREDNKPLTFDDDVLIAVEVKYRRYYSHAAESLRLRQRERIGRALSHFLAEQDERNNKYSFLRFDVVLLCQERKPIHLINAWQSQDDLYEF